MSARVLSAAVGVASVAVVAVFGAAGCTLEAEDLPGRPCEGASDCSSAFACVRVPGRETSVCVAKPPPEVVVGCDGADDGDSCGDGDACTEGDICSGGVCAGVAKDCGEDLCVEGVCEVQGQCVELDAVVAAQNAAHPRIAYNAADDEIGVVFEAEVLTRTEVFFSRLSGAGVPVGAPVQLTDGTPATADDADVSSFVADIVFAPEEQRYGVLVADSQLLGGGVQFIAMTRDGIRAGDANLVTDFASAFSVAPARLTWTGALFVAAARDIGQNDDAIVIDDVDANGAGADLLDEVVTRGLFSEVDIDANRRTGELGIAFITADVDGNAEVHFARTGSDGSVLVERVLSRAPSFSVEVATNDTGYVVAWREGDDAARKVMAARLDDDGTVVVQPKAITDPGENGQTPGLTGLGDGAGLAYFGSIDGALVVRFRKLAADLSSTAPITLRGGLGGGFQPSVDAAAGSVVVGFGASDTAGTSGDVAVARTCP